MTNIDHSIIQIIKHARQLLFHNTGEWKNDHNLLFDVTMSNFDNAKLCELVGLYVLTEISGLIDLDNGGL